MNILSSGKIGKEKIDKYAYEKGSLRGFGSTT